MDSTIKDWRDSLPDKLTEGGKTTTPTSAQASPTVSVHIAATTKLSRPINQMQVRDITEFNF
jgi:hypothetical protein